MKKLSDFRLWVQNIWYENCQEHFAWREPGFTLQEYFQQYKWWLRREYRYQTRK